MKSVGCHRPSFGLFATALGVTLGLSTLRAFAESSQLVTLPDTPPVIEAPPVSGTIQADVPEVSSAPGPVISVHQPWALSLPSGATGFVLDRGNLEATLGSPDVLFQRVGVDGTAIGALYGISDHLTVGLSVRPGSFGSSNGQTLLLGEIKWNFLNTENWTWSVRPRLAYGLSNDTYPTSPVPWSAELIGTRVYDERHRLHVDLAAASNSGADYGDLNQRQIFRGTLAYEWRFHPSWALTPSLSPQYQNENFDDSGFPGFGDRSVSALLGLGLSYLGEHFGATLQVEAGPTFYLSNDSLQLSSDGFTWVDEGSPSHFSWMNNGTIASSISYRF